MYIRTKDGVYEVKVNKYHELVYCKNNQIVLSCNILKQSENLEELCDEFVGYVGEEYVKENKTYGMPNFQEYDLKDMLFHMSYDKRDCVVYGAIWTDKGLIYVAKMNESGELVLI